MSDDNGNSLTPYPVITVLQRLRLGRLDSPRGIARALTRIARAVLDGRLDSQQANSAVYALNNAAKIMLTIQSPVDASGNPTWRENAIDVKTKTAALPAITNAHDAALQYQQLMQGNITAEEYVEASNRAEKRTLVEAQKLKGLGFAAFAALRNAPPTDPNTPCTLDPETEGDIP